MKSLEGIKQKYNRFSDKHPIVTAMGETGVALALKYALDGSRYQHVPNRLLARQEYNDNSKARMVKMGMVALSSAYMANRRG